MYLKLNVRNFLFSKMLAHWLHIHSKSPPFSWWYLNLHMPTVENFDNFTTALWGILVCILDHFNLALQQQLISSSHVHLTMQRAWKHTLHVQSTCCRYDRWLVKWSFSFVPRKGSGHETSGVSVCLRPGASLTCLKMASEIVRDGESFQLESFVRGHHV